MGDSLFHIDIVCDFMISKGGKVRNQELVTHFKRFLNDPAHKASNREKFKEFVNTLATVKLDERGEKVLVLKKRYRDGFVVATPSKGVDIQERGPRHEMQRPKAKLRDNFEGSPAPYTPQRDPIVLPREANMAPLPTPDQMLETPMDMQGSASELSLQESFLDDNKENTHLQDSSSRGSFDMMSSRGSFDMMSSRGSFDMMSGSMDMMSGSIDVVGAGVGESSTDGMETGDGIGAVMLQGAVMSESSSDVMDTEDVSGASIPLSHPQGAGGEDSRWRAESPAEGLRLGPPTGESSTDSPAANDTSMEDNVFSTPVKSHISKLAAAETGAVVTTPVSVKDRARHLNRMTSETELVSQSSSPTTSHQSRANKSEARAALRKQIATSKADDDDDSNSVSSFGVELEVAERQWMVQCSNSDYHEMHKMLQPNPQLARKKNFISGYTALHWAAKHGKPEVIKLLMSTNLCDINARSNGGYTPLHLACQQGHEEIVQLLIQGYYADTKLRDYSGKRAKQYMHNSASSNTTQLLAERRISSNAPPSNFKRQGSGSAKTSKAGFFGISGNSAVRSSWTDQGAIKERGRSRSPSISPKSSPGSTRKIRSPSPRLKSPRNMTAASSFPILSDAVRVQDEMMMPPPKGMSVRRSKKKSRGEDSPGQASSDSEMQSQMHRSGSLPEVTKPSRSQFI